MWSFCSPSGQLKSSVSRNDDCHRIIERSVSFEQILNTCGWNCPFANNCFTGGPRLVHLVHRSPNYSLRQCIFFFMLVSFVSLLGKKTSLLVLKGKINVSHKRKKSNKYNWYALLINAFILDMDLTIPLVNNLLKYHYYFWKIKKNNYNSQKCV